MAIYKDYGTPPTTNVTGRVAGQMPERTQKGNGTLVGDGSTGQFRAGRALSPLSTRDLESPIEWAISADETLALGDLTEALAVAVKDGESELRLRFTSEDGTTDVLEADFNGTTLTINGAATGSVLEVAASPTGGSNIAVSVTADVLSIVAGAAVTADTVLVIRRVVHS